MLKRCLWLSALLAGCSDPSANIAPEARGGSDANVFVGDSAVLDGSQSRDPEERDLTFSWTLVSAPEGSAFPLSEVSTSVTHSFSPDVAGAYLFSLVVDDGKVSSAPDMVAVMARNELAVRQIVPQDGALGVSGRTPVVALFAAPVRPWSATDALVVEDVSDPGNPQPFLGVSALDDGDTAIVFTPVQDWEDSHTYRATLRTTVMGLDGAPLREPAISEFTGAGVDAVAPFVLSVSPANESTNQSASSVVTWILSEPVDALTATSAAGLSDGAAVEGSVEIGAGGVRVTFVPTAGGVPAALAPDTQHVATLGGLLEDLAGNALENGDVVSGFRTAPGADGTAPRILSVSPFRGAADVLVKLPTVVSFSEPVDPATVTPASFLVSSGGEPIAGTVSMELGNRVAVFTQAINLKTASRIDVEVTAAITDLAGNALESPLSSFFTTGDIAPPSVSGTAPNFAPIASTTTIDVLGDDFLPGATVAVAGGGVLVDSVTWIDESDIQVSLTLSPAAAVGPRAVIVTNPDQQQGTGLNVFEVLERPPFVGSAFPDFASQRESGVPITLSGNYFQEGAQVSISGSGVSVDSVSFVSESELTVVVSIEEDAPIGLRNFTVQNPDGQAGTLDAAFLVRLPLVTGASPDPQQGDTLDVTITGNYLSPTPEVTTSVPGAVVNNVTFVSETQLTVNLTVPFSAPLGTYDVTVTNPDDTTGTSNVLTVVTAPPPVVTSASPARGACGQTVDVTISGAEFQSGATVAVAGGGVTTNSTTFTSASTLVANLTIGACPQTFTARDVTVTNPVGTVNMATGTALFRVTDVAPTVTAVSPAFDQQNASPNGIQITGTNFRTGVQVSFGADIAVSNVVVANMAGTLITCDLDIDAGAEIGFRDVVVTNTDTSTATLVSGFEVQPSGGGPNISALVRKHVGGKRADSASSIRQGQSNVKFHILGSGFQSGATVAISGSGVTVSNVTFRSSARIDVDLSLACGDVIPGGRDIFVTNPAPPAGNGLSDSLVNGLTVRSGVVINEVATQERTLHGQGGLLPPNQEVVELHNGSSCTFDITNWRIDFVDAGGVGGYEMGAGQPEVYSSGASRTSFIPGAHVLIRQPAGGNTFSNSIFFSLFTTTGRYIDDVEIGDNEENDSVSDGAPAAGNDGGNASAAEEMVGRCPNGSDTDGDIFDFFQNEGGGAQMAATDAASNDGQCPPCADGVDNDGDGWFDMLDAGCTDPHTDAAETGDPTPATLCNDGIDNGDGGGIDENDPDCFSASDNNEAS